MGQFKDWERLQALNGGEKLYYVDPALDVPGEVWFTAAGNKMRVAKAGQLYRGEVSLPSAGPSRRELWHHARRDLFVEFLEFPSETYATLAHNNGSLLHLQLEHTQLEDWKQHYRRLGFRLVGSWHLNSFTRIARSYFNPEKGSAVVFVDGTQFGCRGKSQAAAECSTREEAEQLAEAHCAGLCMSGYRLHRIEHEDSLKENPPTVTPAPRPVLASYRQPNTAYEAVDIAVARLTELHRVFPLSHLVVELLSLPADEARVDSVVRDAGFFCDLHADRIGQWQAPRPAPEAGSSFDYFVAKYGTLTWVFASTPQEGRDTLQCFYCGNVSGGGWSPLEIRADEFEVEAPGLACLKVFHGGWHHGHSFALDTRVADQNHEHPIVPFAESDSRLGEPGEVVAFGHWLLRRVEKFSAVAVPWLATMQESSG